MKIIGEKINGTLKLVQKAILERNSEYIQNLAVKQVDAGVDWLDINAGTHPDRETEDLTWLISCVQEITDVPLCLDSANHDPLAAALDIIGKTPMVNSISLEKNKIDTILPLVAENGCDVIALAMNEHGIPENTEKRLHIIRELLSITREHGISDDRVYIDPLVMAASTNIQNGSYVLDTIRISREEFPEVHFSVGLSNISFGLPLRSLVNQTFMALAISFGLDTAILDPLDRDLRGTMLAAELILGRDRHCQQFSRAYKKGSIGPRT